MSYKFRSICLKFSSVAFFLLFIQYGFAQKTVKKYGVEKHKALDAAIKEKVSIIGKDLVVMLWTDTLQYKTELGDFNSKTVAPIASCSKWLTAALIMQFVDEGKLSLDDKVSKYLPIFESYGKSYITIRHCLSHMTGIESDRNFMQRKRFSSLDEEIESFAKKEIRANAGEEFRYSNIGLNIAGRVLEVISKKKFDMLIKQKLFGPLGMRQTTFSNLDMSAPNPSGGAKSTAEEYMNFLVMLLNNGMYKGKQILSEASVAELRKMQAAPSSIKYAPRSAEGFGYALGSWVIEEDGKGNATSLASPGLFGTWPMIDWKRGYTVIFFVKSFLGEQKADAYMELKRVIDNSVKK
jgi:CubicO group peptidase (beta-lactamase class C family)